MAEPPLFPHHDENPLGRHLPLDPLPGHSSRGRLERVLRRGEFAVTAELNPPDSADPEEVYARAAIFEGWVDGINAVDASGANCHMSSVGICALLTRMGYAPICRSPAATRTASPSRATCWVRRQWAWPISSASPATACRPATSRAPSRSLISTACRCSRPCGSCATSRSSSPAASSPRRPRSSWAARSTPSRPLTISAPPAGQEDRGRGAVRPEPVLLRRADVPPLYGARSRSGLRREVLHPGRRRAARLGPHGALDAGERPRRPYSRRHHRPARRRGRPEEGRQAALHRHHQRGEGDCRRLGRSRHGLPPGRICSGDRA